MRTRMRPREIHSRKRERSVETAKGVKKGPSAKATILSFQMTSAAEEEEEEPRDDSGTESDDEMEEDDATGTAAVDGSATAVAVVLPPGGHGLPVGHRIVKGRIERYAQGIM